jgi:hypothetical protein
MAVNVSGDANTIEISNLPAKTSFVVVSGNNIYLKNRNGNFSPKAGFKDGYYQYQIFAKVSSKLADKSEPTYKMSLNNGRAPNARPSKTPVTLVEKGGFRILKGRRIELKKIEGKTQ